ncbi:E3 ubiquitin-protein ligase SHPRH [Amphibalanus amphitrite]|uniref:E3 ubiquitin-protein ligase SHPRH n=1 Tax=Amphibalanus amphitrite TaxID=1232801 RepID=A0A6A4WFL0_AMPAM|nr:E3 ubiquitin-protein ligase SHPRH [Amphibalanus amphitrite]
MLEKFSSVTGLQRLLMERLMKLAELREETQEGVGQLVVINPTELVSAAVDCHLRPSHSDAERCRLCEAHDAFERYERELFYMAQSRVDASEMGGVEGKISVHGELRRGNWGDNETERVLKVLLSQARQLGMNQILIELGGHHIKMLETMKKEFKSLRILWRHVNDRVSASDELEMAVLRLRTRYVDEPPPDLPVAQGGQELPTYVIEPHEVDLHRGKLAADRAVSENDLRRKLGQRLYLTNLKKSGVEHRNGNPEPCPICETALGTNWSRIIEEFSMGGRRDKLKCAICREFTRHSDIAYVNATCASDEDGAGGAIRVRGSHSTKVEAVVRCVLTILRDDPGAKTLVFATWTDALDVIGGALEMNNVTFRSLHTGKFQQKLREFRTLPDVSVLLLPIHSGANGLNLIEATHVVLTHPVLDPGSERQAVGRVHRIGQRRATVVHRLVVRDTIEERVLALNAT